MAKKVEGPARPSGWRSVVVQFPDKFWDVQDGSTLLGAYLGRSVPKKEEGQDRLAFHTFELSHPVPGKQPTEEKTPEGKDIYRDVVCEKGERVGVWDSAGLRALADIKRGTQVWLHALPKIQVARGDFRPFEVEVPPEE